MSCQIKAAYTCGSSLFTICYTAVNLYIVTLTYTNTKFNYQSNLE